MQIKFFDQFCQYKIYGCTVAVLSRCFFPETFLRENRKSGLSSPWSLRAWGSGACKRDSQRSHSHSSPELPGLPGQRYNTCSSSGISALIMWFLSSPDGSMIDHRGCKEGEQLFQASCTPQLYKICSYAIICSVVIPGLNCCRGNHWSQLFEGGYPPATSKCPGWKDIIQQHSLYVLYSRGFSYWLTNRKINYIAICYNCKIWLKPELF